MTLIFRRGTFPRSLWSGTIIRRSELGGLCLIIDRDLLRVGPEQAMLQALAAGVRFFQYRDKNGTRKSIYEASVRLAGTAAQAKACFIVNDHADIAAASGADGVHLGQDDLPIEYARKLLGNDKLIGISTHSLEQAGAAEAAGADYIGFGPIFKTSTKDAGRTQGIRTLAMVRKAVVLPVIAIGGVNQANVEFILRAGADGAAVISAVLSTGDIQRASEEMLRIMKRSGGNP
jgi:thiamine-phosphate pyrophosphorylase